MGSGLASKGPNLNQTGPWPVYRGEIVIRGIAMSVLEPMGGFWEDDKEAITCEEGGVDW